MKDFVLIFSFNSIFKKRKIFYSSALVSIVKFERVARRLVNILNANGSSGYYHKIKGLDRYVVRETNKR